MSGPFYVGAYWGPRPESSEACTERLFSCLTGLAEIDDAFGGWRPKARSSAKALAEKPVALERASLVGLVDAGRNRRETDQHVIEELGFSVFLWNGNPSCPISFGMTCGSFAGPRIGNVFTLQLPSDPTLCAWLPFEKARRLVACLVTSWEPHWATLTSHEWRRAQQAADTTPVVGWLTYLPNFSTSQLLPPSARSERLSARGILVSASDECDEQLGDKVAKVAIALAEGGALEW